MRVGFAGLGRMGAHMARNLSRAGHEVTLWNRSPDKARDLAAELRCDLADSPRELSDAAVRSGHIRSAIPITSGQ
ncbi:NAD(P)-binding domain-containing protein [Roseovarius salinarum]|uniref:NAD(P)-binding domain-containing protein n=1 Tax=Roseovarius salinarum TaxID=1981892 RepID=UPI000C32ED7A|nr:NAD(P)-binding domain-containing protein [Roseovarius salinarum]